MVPVSLERIVSAAWPVQGTLNYTGIVIVPFNCALPEFEAGSRNPWRQPSNLHQCAYVQTHRLQCQPGVNLGPTWW
jgi:hypothetical protein